ncbi:MAG: response regulator transcription factor [Planctomycetota bacterium]
MVADAEEVVPMIAPVRSVAAGRLREARPGASISTVLVGCGRLTHALGLALEEEGVRAYGFERSVHALDEVSRFPPTFVVVGTWITDQDPFDFLAKLRGMNPEMGVLFLADRADRQLATEALMRGADDVLPPPHSVSAILLRAQVLANRQRIAPPANGRGAGDQVRVGHFKIDMSSRRVLHGDAPVSLTGREFELLNRLIRAGGRVVSREELMEDIWGGSPREGVLDATIHRLRKKLEKNLSEPRFVTTVRGIGYRLEVGALATG